MKTPKLSNLVKALEELEAITENVRCQAPYDEYVDMEKLPPALSEKIACLADTLLITSEGGISYSALGYLRTEGFPVTPGETDSFGWLSGCIHTTKGIVVFG
jgi:hypothetical protein